MSRTRCSPAEVFVHALEPEHQSCRVCGKAAWVAYHTKRTLTRLDGTYQLILTIRRCRNQLCSQFHQPYRQKKRELGRSLTASLVSTWNYELRKHHRLTSEKNCPGSHNHPQKTTLTRSLIPTPHQASKH